MITENSMTRKQQIAQAAMEIISEEGMHNLVMVKIAKRIGVTDAALYKHFNSKDDMLLYMIEELEQSMVTKFIEHVGNIEDPFEKLHKLLSMQLEFIEQNKGIPRIIFSESLQQQNKTIKAKIENLLSNYLDMIRNILKSAEDSGHISEEIDIDATSTIFVGMIQASVIFWTLAHFSYSLKDKQASLWQEFRKIIR
jgi:AcrR family transcriptional regulator